jgi:hypothetical protein
MMQCTTRRRLLQLSGIGALAAASGGSPAILALGRAPAFAQGTTLHLTCSLPPCHCRRYHGHPRSIYDHKAKRAF